MSRRSLPLVAVLLGVAVAPAVFNKPIALHDAITGQDLIFVAAVDSVDADKKTVVFKVTDDLKGKCGIAKIPLSLAATTEPAKKGDHTKVMLDRLAPGRTVILFANKKDGSYPTVAFVEGTWFSLKGTADADGKTVRWQFLYCEPALRGTFKGTSDELRKLTADVLGGKAKAPPPDPKEPPGFGPKAEEDKKKECRVFTAGPPFAVIPSTVFVAPLAVLAALFPATFAGLASGFKRWRAFLTVVSVNGLLAAAYFFLREYAALPDSPLAGPTAAAVYLLAVVAVGLAWAGRRYRTAAKLDPAVTDPPARRDVLAVFGFAAASLVVVVGVAVIANWVTTGSLFGLRVADLTKLLFELPTRELTAAIVGLLAAAGYLTYRAATRHADGPSPVRLSAPGEAVALAAMLVFGTVTVVNSIPRTGTATAAVETSTDTAVSSPAVKLTDAAVWFETAEISEAFSAATVTPDRVLFGGIRRKGFESAGVLVCVDRATGKQAWAYTDAEMKTVYSTPVVAGGRVFVGEGLHTDPDCRLLCLDATTGQKLWEKRTTSHTEGAPAVADGKVYFSAGDDGLYCLTTDGGEVWHFRGREQGLHVDSPVVVANGRVYAGSGYQTLAAFALDAATGQPVWRKELPLRSFGQPLVLADQVIYGLGTGNLSFDLSTEPEPGRANEVKPAGAVVCLDAATGDEVWTHDLPRSVHTHLSADGRAVFAACRDGWVYALSRADGRQLWRFSYAQPITTGTAAAAYTRFGFGVAVYSASPTGGVYAHDPLSGKLLWSRDIRQLIDREVEIMAPPTLVAPADGGERQVFVPVSLTHRNTGAKTAAVVRFVDRAAE